MGPLWIEIVAKVDKAKAKEYLEIYKQKMDEHSNFLEVYNKKGRPFKTSFYYTDESMLWVANIAALLKKIR